MPDYDQAVQALQLEASHQAPQLRNLACRPLFLLHPHPTARVCLLFHGFTAAPYQLKPLARVLFRAGYNVIVPALPGHGLVSSSGDWGPFVPPPLPETAEVYHAFARQWLERSRSFGSSRESVVVVGGISEGGTLAAWLGLEQPRAIYKILLVAPFLRQAAVEPCTRLINRYQEWLRPRTPSHHSDPSSPTSLSTLPGYSGFETLALQPFLEMGEEVLRRAQHENAPSSFLISSDNRSDRANQDHRLLFERLLRYQPQTWHLCLKQANNLAHELLLPSAASQHGVLLARLLKGYLESKLTWAGVAALGNRMARGQAFAAAVEQLGVSDRVSPDLPTVMALIDKQQFLTTQQKRQPTINPYPLR